jgi:hypothetical protein
MIFKKFSESKGKNFSNNRAAPILELDLHFLIIHLYTKYHLNPSNHQWGNERKLIFKKFSKSKGSHIGIYGNTKADKAAKDALKFDIALFRIPYTDLKFSIKIYINYLWQTYWDSYHTSNLYSIQNKVNKPCNIVLKREDEVIISRLRIGHSKLTHSYLINKGHHHALLYLQLEWKNLIGRWENIKTR